MKKFKATKGYDYKIEDLEIIKETGSFITYMYKGYSSEYESREKKITDYYGWFDTFDEAKQWLMDQLDIQIKNAQAQVDRLKSQKQKVNNL